MRRVLVTGAGGFVGRQVCRQLQAEGFSVRAGVRNGSGASRIASLGLPVSETVEIGDLKLSHDLSGAVAGCESVVHLAARVHVMNETSRDALAEFRAVNVNGTRRLAEAAERAGVRRFVLVSTIKVNGEHTSPGSPFTETSEINPSDAYAISKAEAEKALWDITAASKLEGVAVRPPLVYGAGVGGNFHRLLAHLRRRKPMVLPKRDNQRSFIGVENLASLLAACAQHPSAKNQLFVASDGRDLSTCGLVELLAAALDIRPMILRVPDQALALARVVPVLDRMMRRLGDYLQIDSSKARNTLNWRPVMSVDDGLRATAQSFLASENGRSGR